jgi:FLVCR family feline leukemia virus subgroup C receptor-related protein
MTSYQVVPTVQPSAAPQRTHSKTELDEETQKLNVAGAREELCLSPLPTQTKVYRRRWLMLVIFILVSMSSAFQWIQFSIINNLIMKYWEKIFFNGLLCQEPRIIFLFSILQVLQR